MYESQSVSGKYVHAGNRIPSALTVLNICPGTLRTPIFSKNKKKKKKRIKTQYVYVGHSNMSP
jgi:hypothetical protein